MNILLYIFLGLLILILLGLGGYLLLGLYLYRYSLSRKSKLKRSIERKSKDYLKDMKIDTDYFNKDFKTLNIISKDNLKLFGYYKDNGGQKLVILVHGFGETHVDMTNYAKLFEEKQYDILAIDLRTHGRSEGDFVSLGFYEQEDLKLWVSEILKIKPNYKIVLFGISLGASTVCLSTSELPSNVVLAIEDSGFDNAWKEIEHIFKKTKLKLNLFLKVFYTYMKNTKGVDLKKIDVQSNLKKSTIPILFIHGGNDDFVPTSMVYNLYEAVPQTRRELFVCNDASHVMSYSIETMKYKRIVKSFLEKYYM